MADAADSTAPSSVPEGPSPDKRARSAEQTPVVALYSYWRSSSSYRVRIALNWKRIPFEYRAVHLVKEGGQQLKDAYAAVNPMREVPTLIIHGRTLTQSAGRWATRFLVTVLLATVVIFRRPASLASYH